MTYNWSVKTLNLDKRTVYILCHDHTGDPTLQAEDFELFSIMPSIGIGENTYCSHCGEEPPEHMTNNVLFLNKLETSQL